MTARVGVFGGTFDPPHNGHVAVAAEVAWALQLDEMLWVPAGDPWQKTAQQTVTPATVRTEMVRAATSDMPRHSVSEIEVRRAGPSYTVDTLGELARADRELLLVLGADAALGLGSWHRADEIASLATIVVVARHDSSDEVVDSEMGHRWPHASVPVPRLDISSSEIRSRVADGRPIAGLVPRAVCSVIETRGLYGERR